MAWESLQVGGCLPMISPIPLLAFANSQFFLIFLTKDSIPIATCRVSAQWVLSEVRGLARIRVLTFIALRIKPSSLPLPYGRQPAFLLISALLTCHIASVGHEAGPVGLAERPAGPTAKP